MLIGNCLTRLTIVTVFCRTIWSLVHLPGIFLTTSRLPVFLGSGNVFKRCEFAENGFRKWVALAEDCKDMRFNHVLNEVTIHNHES